MGTEKIAAWSGVACVAFVLASNILLGPIRGAAGRPDSDVLGIVTQIEIRLLLGAWFDALAAACLLAFGAALAVSRRGASPLASVLALAAVTIGASLELVIDGLLVGLSVAARADPSGISTILLLLRSNQFFGVPNALFAGGAMVLVTGAGFARWLAIAAGVVALANLASTPVGLLSGAPAGLAAFASLLLWVLAASLLLLRRTEGSQTTAGRFARS